MTTDRARIILEDLEQTLLEFMRKHRITHDEYRCATDILVATVKAGEESLLYDVFFEAQATDVDNIGRQGSIEAIEGPFYLPNSPRLEAPYALPRRSDERGDALFFCGRVTSSARRLPYLIDAQANLFCAKELVSMMCFQKIAPALVAQLLGSGGRVDNVGEEHRRKDAVASRHGDRAG
jgi:hypothetical protein